MPDVSQRQIGVACKRFVPNGAGEKGSSDELSNGPQATIGGSLWTGVAAHRLRELADARPKF